MATFEINYKSDFTLVMGFTLAGVAVPLPVGNFRIVFRTQEYGTEYECSRINGEYVNCKDNGNDTLLCIFDRHGLRPGALRGEVFDYIPDTTFPDGSQLVVTPSLFDIELVEGAGNTSEGVTAEVVISVEEVVGQARDAALAAENAAESANAAAGSASDAADRANDAADAATEAIADLDTKLAAKQDTLVSGQNVKTINNLSLLGSGNIDIQGGGGEQVQSDWTETDSSNPAYIKNKPTLATVATSGSYNDLADKPSIREAIIGMIDANEDFYRLIGYNQLGRPSYSPTKDTPSNIYFYIDLPTGKMYRYYDGTGWSVGDSHWKPFLATVATSGSYNDLSNKPTIPAAQVNADWDAASGVAAILNKPTIPVVPTNVSAFTNDASYATTSQVATAVATKQDLLVSGTNIKAVNNQSLLGSGNITIPAGADGKGIASIVKTGTSGLVDTYTITYTDGTTSTYTVTNGAQGQQGNSGYTGAAGELEVVNNLTDGGATAALSAEMGKELKGMVDSCAHFGDDDKIILNQPLLDLIGTEGVDYTVIENMKFSAWNGNITTATGNYLILVTMKNGVISHKGLPISGYKGWWTADVKPSTSDPAVDVDGNAVTYTKTYYNNGTRNNVAVAKPYLLFDAGTDVSNFVMAFLAFIPTPIYDVKSVNDGIRIVSSSIDGVGNKTLELLQKGIATKHNSLDTNCVIGGMKFDGASPFKLLADANSSIYLQPIPSGAQNVVVRGLQGTSGTTYHRVFILNESLTIIANDNIYGTTVVNQYVSLENVTGAKYLAFNASGAQVANAIDEVLVLYDAPKDYNYWLAYNNYFEGEKAMLDIPYETGGFKSCMTYANLISRNDTVFDFLCVGITERYATFIFPDASYNNTADTLVQYDENDNVLKSESLYSAAKTNFGKSDTNLVQIRLVEGCVKMKYRFVSKLELRMLSLEELIARGNKVILSNRTVEWGNNRVKSINGIPLNINTYSPLKGKLICCMGDSITDFGSSSTNGSWAWYIQRNYDCGVANYGRGNAHFCDVANTDPTADTNPGAGSTSTTPNNVVSTQVRWCIRELTADNITPDAIVLTGLTNDAYSTVNLGDLQTSLDAYPMTADAVHTDFYGAAVYMVSKLRSAFPSAKIFFATPPRSLNPTQMQRLVQYVEAMRNVAKALGCGVIDFFDESLVEYPKATYNASNESWTHNNPMYNTNDVLHPSQLGVNKMGQLASAKLSEYLQ